MSQVLTLKSGKGERWHPLPKGSFNSHLVVAPSCTTHQQIDHRGRPSQQTVLCLSTPNATQKSAFIPPICRVPQAQHP